MPRRRVTLDPTRSALMVVDMQRYYLESQASFARYFEHIHPGAMEYIGERCRQLVVPNLVRLLDGWRARGSKVVYLRLCGTRPDRTDLHPSFLEVNVAACKLGFENVYPLQDDPFSDVAPALQPQPWDTVFCKTTYSGFTSSPLEGWLAEQHLETLVFTGLATSQCVETTARDAADRGYNIIHVHDAQADYEDTTHRASLYSSRGICGGHVYSTSDLLELME